MAQLVRVAGVTGGAAGRLVGPASLAVAAGTHWFEPGGMTQRTRNTFASTTEDGWVPREGSPAQTVQLTSDPTSPLVLLGSGTAPVSGPAVLQARYASSLSAGSGPILTQRAWAGSGAGDNEIYIDSYIQLSTNFHLGYAGMSGTSKLFFFELDAGNQGVIGLAGFRYNNPQVRVSLQNCVRSPSGVVPGVTDMNTSGSLGVNIGAPLVRGTWNRIIVRAVKNTVDPTTTGTWDGILQVWVNPAGPGAPPNLDLSHIGYVGTNTAAGKPLSARFNQVKINPTWTGGLATGSDGTLAGGTSTPGTSTPGAYGPFYAWYDDLYVSGK